MSDEITAYAHVEVTVRVTCSSWGDKCQLDQVYRQSASEAVNRVRALVAKEGMIVVGEPRVTTVLTERPR